MKKDTEGIVILNPISEHEKINNVMEYANSILKGKENSILKSIDKMEDVQMEKIFLMAEYNEFDDELCDIYYYAKNVLSNYAAIFIIQGYEV